MSGIVVDDEMKGEIGRGLLIDQLEKKMFGSEVHGKSSVVAPYPRSEPVCMTRPVSDAASNSHPVAALSSAAPISRLRRARAQEGGTILFFGF